MADPSREQQQDDRRSELLAMLAECRDMRSALYGQLDRLYKRGTAVRIEQWKQVMQDRITRAEEHIFSIQRLIMEGSPYFGHWPHLQATALQRVDTMRQEMTAWGDPFVPVPEQVVRLERIAHGFYAPLLRVLFNAPRHRDQGVIEQLQPFMGDHLADLVVAFRTGLVFVFGQDLFNTIRDTLLQGDAALPRNVERFLMGDAAYRHCRELHAIAWGKDAYRNARNALPAMGQLLIGRGRIDHAILLYLQSLAPPQRVSVIYPEEWKGEPSEAPEGTPDDDLCRLCLTRSRATVNNDCGHMVYCVRCAVETRPTTCPVCRAVLVRVMRVYK